MCPSCPQACITFGGLARVLLARVLLDWQSVHVRPERHRFGVFDRCRKVRQHPGPACQSGFELDAHPCQFPLHDLACPVLVVAQLGMRVQVVADAHNRSSGESRGLPGGAVGLCESGCEMRSLLHFGTFKLRVETSFGADGFEPLGSRSWTRFLRRCHLRTTDNPNKGHPCLPLWLRRGIYCPVSRAVNFQVSLQSPHDPKKARRRRSDPT